MIKKAHISLSINNSYGTLKQNPIIDGDYLNMKEWILGYPLEIFSDNLSQIYQFSQNRMRTIPNYTNCSVLEPKIQLFIMTRENGKRFYCVSCTFYQKSYLQIYDAPTCTTFQQQPQQYYVPHALILYSQTAYFKMMINIINIYKNQKYIETKNKHTKQSKQIHQVVLSASRRTSKNRLIIKSTETIEYYLRLANDNFLGQKIYISANQSNHEIFHLYSLPDTIYRFSYFYNLSVSDAILAKILYAILQQKQLIFVSSSSNNNVNVIQTILSTITPFKWDFMYIPNLPHSLIQVVNEAFMPFIVGITYQCLSKLQNKKDKIIIYIDEDLISGEQMLGQEPIFIREHICRVKYWRNRAANNIQWQKQMRISGIKMMIKLLQLCSNFEKQKNKNKLSINSLKQKNQVRGSYNKYKRKQQYDSTHKFIEQFVNLSSFYQNYIQTVLQDLSVQFRQIQYILNLKHHLRNDYIQSKFRILQSRAHNPIILSNQIQFSKYQQSKFTSNLTPKNNSTRSNNNLFSHLVQTSRNTQNSKYKNMKTSLNFFNKTFQPNNYKVNVKKAKDSIFSVSQTTCHSSQQIPQIYHTNTPKKYEGNLERRIETRLKIREQSGPLIINQQSKYINFSEKKTPKKLKIPLYPFKARIMTKEEEKRVC